ncbi:MAG: glycosyltransferase family 9 protein [Tannerella sp.]|jgi:ADP-heptose:LPS heptosyltransferase|nr:glycosyltransferase family 9 protein [Tannerella sp.]
MAKILIIRLSAIGDVAMTIPVIYSAAKANPGDSFTVLTQSFLLPLFINRPPNVMLIGMETKGSEKKLGGLLRFAFSLANRKYDMVLDLHDVIRSRIIDLVFRLKGKRVYRIDKKRKERKHLTAKPPKEITPLTAVTACYTDVFNRAGFNFDDIFTSLFADNQDESFTLPLFGEKKGRRIGFAPFAKHRGKIYPVDEMEKVIEKLSKQPDTTLFFFGGGGYEEAVLSRWELQFPNTYCVAGRFTLFHELELIRRMDLLVCMDSANMHFASLTGTKVVSIWGATHPYAGFYGYKQNPQYAIQVELPCRPCSIYGNIPCHRGDYACLRQITTEQIIDKIHFALDQNEKSSHSS